MDNKGNKDGDNRVGADREAGKTKPEETNIKPKRIIGAERFMSAYDEAILMEKAWMESRS